MDGKELLRRIAELDNEDARDLLHFLDNNLEIRANAESSETVADCWTYLKEVVTEESLQSSLIKLIENSQLVEPDPNDGANDEPKAKAPTPQIPEGDEVNAEAQTPQTPEGDKAQTPKKPAGDEPEAENPGGTEAKAKKTAQISYVEYLAWRQDDDPTIKNLRNILIDSEFEKNSKNAGKDVSLSDIYYAISKREPNEGLVSKDLEHWAKITFFDYKENYDPDFNMDEETNLNVLSDKLSILQKFAIGAIIGLGFILIIWGFQPGHLEMLSRVEIARGFITLLLAVGVLSIFMIVIAAIVFDSDSPKRNVYERSKTILSMLLGIFGTVLGFYFGLQDSKSSSQMTVSEVTTHVAADTKALNIGAVITGGSPDYQVLVTIKDEEGKNLSSLARSYEMQKRALILDSPINLASVSGKKITVNLFVEDSENSQAVAQSGLITVPE